MDEPRINYHYPLFEDQVEPDGHLTRDPRSHACWYFYVLAQKQKAIIGSGHIEDQFGLLEHEPWMDKHYEQTARSVAVIYGLKDPSEFMQFWPMITAEAMRLGMTPPSQEYMKPLRIIV